jgi:hypothetical protein
VVHRRIASFVAIVAALTLSGSVVTASTPAQPAVPAATAHSAASCGRDEDVATEAAMPAKANKGKSGEAHGKAHAHEQGDDTEEQTAAHERKQNHGWFVSQAAHDQSLTGSEHGKAVSEVARGNAGKPEAADK